MKYVRPILFASMLLLAAGGAGATGTVTFDPWPSGLQYGAVYGTGPGDWLNGESGIDCTAEVFYNGAGTSFQQGGIASASGAFGTGQVLSLAAIGMGFDFHGPGDVSFDFADFGGNDNLRVNGGVPWIIADFRTLDGKEVAPGVIATVDANGTTGSVTLVGPVLTIEIGGAELLIDNIKHTGITPPDTSGAMNEDCDILVSHETQPVGTQWTAPRDLLFTESSIPVYSESLTNGANSIYDFIGIQNAGSIGSGHVAHLSKASQVFNLESLGLVATRITWVFHDHNDFINLQIDGGGLYQGSILSAPANPFPGVTLTVQAQLSGTGVLGSVTLTGSVRRLLFGGLDLEADAFCFVLGSGPVIGSCDQIVDMEDQTISTVWNAPGTQPGDWIFDEEGISVGMDTYNPGSGPVFGLAAINNGVAGFEDGHVLYLHDCSSVFDFTALGTTAEVRLDYRDSGGTEILQVNGAPAVVGEIYAAGGTVAPGVTLTNLVTTQSSGSKQGTLIFTGAVESVRLGAMDIHLDNVCVRLDNLHTAVETTGAPPRFELGNAYPNPFNPTTTLSLRLKTASRIVLTVHDAAGRKVRTLATGELSAGAHELTWDGRDDRGRSVSAGVYFARATSSDGVQVRKLALIK